MNEGKRNIKKKVDEDKMGKKGIQKRQKVI